MQVFDVEASKKGLKQTSKRDPKMSPNTRFDSLLGSLGDFLGLSWAGLGPFLAHLGPVLILGPLLAHLGLLLAHLGPFLVHVGHLLGRLRPLFVMYGLSRAILEPLLDDSEVKRPQHLPR